MDFILNTFVLIQFFMGIMIKFNWILFLAFFFFTCSIFSQKKIIDSLFNIEINKIVEEYKSEPNFHKSSIFFQQKKWDSTLMYSMKHLSVSNQNKILINYCHFYRGYSFKNKKLLKQAQKEFNSITTGFEFYYRVTSNLGDIALSQSKYKEAISYFQELLNLPTNKSFLFSRSNVLHNLGLCYLHLNQFKKAEPYLIESVQLNEQQKDTIKMIGSYGDIATLYYEQYKDNLAIPYFKKAYDLSKHTKDFSVKLITALNMAVVEENRKNYKVSIAYRKEYEKWKDSLNDQNKVWEVAELEKEFAVKQKQKEVNILAAENKLKVAERNKLLFAAVGLLLLLLTGAYFYREKIKANKIIVAQKSELDELNATKDKLFSIVSHDLRSSVHALKTSNNKLQESLETKNYTELDTQLNTNNAITNGAYNLLDNLLNWALLQTKQGYFEITSMRLFFIVEHVAYNYKALLLDKNITLENKVAKKYRVDADQESLKIILRNLLDNAIKFTNEKGHIHLYATSSDNYCNLIIEDTGLGMSENTRLELLKNTTLLSKKENEEIIGTGLGMQLVKQMIAKNNGTFNIESKLGKGTKMIVSLPKTAT